MDKAGDSDGSKIQAEGNSIAIGGISVGGNVGDIRIGHTQVYQYESEEDVPLTSDEIEIGLTRFSQYIPERAPILQERFSSIAKKLRATLGADSKSLSPTLKTEREDTVKQMKSMCMEVLDISFRALCTGQNPPPYNSRPPFLGLFAFHPEDREFYFGRDELVKRLVNRIRKHPFLAVMGASGSGKSSLVMAGLIPALEAQMSYLTPSSAPLERLHAAQENTDKDTVFVVDQFEELFTITRDAGVRETFIREMLELTQTNRLVVTMRADFWGEVATYADLKQAMQDHQELIAPMDTDELHSAMEQQAAAGSLRFDLTLSEAIYEEVKDAPGAMPLLQHALWMLWKCRHGFWLKAEEYRAFGGVKQAIASAAEDLYASCTDFEQSLIRNYFLRLTRLDDSGEGRDTRRRVSIKELIPANSDATATIQLLNKLADARLIVKTDKEVEVAHEALIRHWERLSDWLNDDRDNLRLREGVSEDAREWEKSNCDESLLNHRGGRLELALAMSQNPRYQLNPTEQAYLNACVDVRERARIEKEQQQRHELEGAKKLAETAQAQVKAEQRARQVTIGILLVAALLIVVLGYLSYVPIRNEIWRRQLMKSDMVKIPAGDYILGDKRVEAFPGNFLIYQKYPISAFSIDTSPVTNKSYWLCIQAGVCSRPEAMQSEYKDPKNGNKYVVNITAVNAAGFCNWLGKRLPSEKEWELAMRKGVLNLINPDALLDGISFYEWTTSPYDQKDPEWLDTSIDPPEVLMQRGGQLSESEISDTYMTMRQNQGSMLSDSKGGFRCAIDD